MAADWRNNWKGDKLGSSISGTISGISDVIAAGASNAQIADTSNIENAIEETADTDFSYNDYDSLANTFNLGALQKTNLTGSDVRGISGGKQALNVLSAVGSGASAGSLFGPVGTAIGAIGGLVSGALGSEIGNRKAQKEARRLNAAAEEANKRYLANFANNAENIGQRNFNTALLNLSAYGGLLKNKSVDNYTKSRVRLKAFGGGLNTQYQTNNIFDNGITFINEGGTHEQNPYDGVLMGVDPQGVPNLVEEGEAIYNDYVFSNRLAPTEQQLEQIGLPVKYAGKPFSKIVRNISGESEQRPLDSISKATLEDTLMKLTTLQEEQRERDMEYQDMAEAESIFAGGGQIHIDPSKKGTFTAAAKKHGMGVQEFASKVLANPNRYSEAMRKKAQFARNAKSFKHAFGGDLNNNVNPKYKEDIDSLELAKSARIFSDILGNGKTLVENISAIPPYYKFGNGKRLFDEAYQSKLGAPHSWYLENENRVKQKLIEQADRIESNQKVHAFGGPIGNMFAGPGSETQYVLRDGELVPETTYTEEMVPYNGELIPVSEYNKLVAANNARNNQQTVNTPSSEFNVSDIFRFAPVVGSSLQSLADAFGWDNKEDYSNPDIINRARRSMRNVSSRPIGNYQTYRPFDLDYEQNRLQNVALGAQRGMLDTALGNAGAARNAMLALNLGTQGQMGDLYRKADEYNDAQRLNIAQFNTGIDQFNAQQGLQADVYNQRRDETNAELAVREAMLRDNIESTLSQARSNNRTQFYNNVGNFGRDRTYADMARWYQQYIAPWNDATRAYRSGFAKGGKVNRVKEFKRK